MTEQSHPVLVVDFGAQYAQLIARRVREAGIYSEIVPANITVTELRQKSPQAIILSGGPASVYAENSPDCATELFQLGIPVLGICYGFQLMAKHLGGKVKHTDTSEYGRTQLTAQQGILHQATNDQSVVWMSHRDQVVQSPAGFTVNAATEKVAIAGFENLDRKMAGVQYHPEVIHSDIGKQVLENFLYLIAGLKPTWNTNSIEAELLKQVKQQVGDKQAICGLSGGVDSAVAAALVQKAIGDKLTCIFVDHGLLRAGEREQVEKDFVATTGVKLITIDAKETFLNKLAGVTDPETKRKIIGELFIRTFEKAVTELLANTADQTSTIDFLVQGTLYPDVVESGGGNGTASIKSHHNVGGLPEDINFQLVEPLRTLFKDEVRALGKQLGLPDVIVNRQPFPGPGLAIRIVGEVNEANLKILRLADAIVRQELTSAGLDKEIWQSPVVLLADVRSVGVQGDGRTYGHPIVLRPVTSEDAMTADWARVPYPVLEKISTRITNEVPEVNRVVLDVTSKPPGTIEWE